MNIEDIRPGMQVRVKTIDELRSEGHIEHRDSFIDFKPPLEFGCIEYRRPYFGGIFRVENVSGACVYLNSCYYNDPDIIKANELIWWDAKLLSRVEDAVEIEDDLDETELSSFLDGFVQK